MLRSYLDAYAIGCNWRHNDVDNLAAVTSGLGGRALSHICRLLAQDYSYWGRGIADLVLWRDNEKLSPSDNPEEGTKSQAESPRAMLVEVKSLNDSFSHIQKAWFSELIAMGVACEEFRVIDKDPDVDA